MKYLILIFSIVSLSAGAQDLDRYVVQKYKDGTPKVVVYVEKGSSERIKEEIYYAGGQLDYVGHYKNGVEHGTWTYFWPNGNLRSTEFYTNGMEEGTGFDYNRQGEKIKAYHYRKGALIGEEEY